MNGNRNDQLTQGKKLIKGAKRIMVLSGAGLSTEAGIPDFRSKDGLYSVDFHGYEPERILSASFLLNEPELFYEYLRTQLNYTNIQPGPSYKILAQQEAQGKILGVATQNIDSLHQMAGSKNVVELHGSFARFYCPSCNTDYEPERMMTSETPITCSCGDTIRPDVVLYDEEVAKLTDAYFMADSSDLLLVLGTSLLVYPAAHIPQLFLSQNRPVIIINRDPTPYAPYENVLEIHEDIGGTLKQLFDSSPR